MSINCNLTFSRVPVSRVCQERQPQCCGHCRHRVPTESVFLFTREGAIHTHQFPEEIYSLVPSEQQCTHTASPIFTHYPLYQGPHPSVFVVGVGGILQAGGQYKLALW